MLIALGIAEPLLLGSGQVEIAGHPRIHAVGELLRSRRPDRVHDGVHALDLACDPLRFAAGLVALGDAEGCIAGAVCTTADVLRAGLWAIGLGAEKFTLDGRHEFAFGLTPR